VSSPMKLRDQTAAHGSGRVRMQVRFRRAGPRWRRSMRLIMVTEPLVVGESRRLWLPRIPSGVLRPSGCDSLHRPGYRVLRPSPRKAEPTGSTFHTV
jgi:hypothetical protein